MRPLIALKRRNFPYDFNFKCKTVTKFLIRSHFLLIKNNMTIKQQLNHGTIQKVGHLHNGIFHPIHICHTLSILLFHVPYVID